MRYLQGLLRWRRKVLPPHSMTTTIMAAALAVMVLATLAFGGYTLGRIADNMQHMAEGNASAIARMVAGNSAAALVTEQLNNLQSSAIDAVQLPNIERISIYRATGINLIEARRQRDGVHVYTGAHLDPAQRAAGLPASHMEDTRYVAWQEADSSNPDANVWVRVDYSLDEQNSVLRSLTVQALGGTLARWAVVMVCLYLIIRRVLRPVRELTEFAAMIPLRMGEELHLQGASTEAHALQAAINQASRGMAAQVNRVQAIVNTAAEAIIGLDEFGRVTSTNPAASSIFGRTAEDIEGQMIDRCVPGLDAQALHAMFGEGMEHLSLIHI